MPPVGTGRVRLEARRLHLRMLADTDADIIGRLFERPEVHRHLAVDVEPGKGARRFAEEFVARSHEEFRSAGCGALAVMQHRPSALVGYCGLRPLPDRPDAAELMYAIAPERWGRGLATEAAHTVLAWGFENLPVEEVLGMARPENLASRRVLEKLGMRYAGLCDRYYEPALALYRLDRANWQATRLSAYRQSALAAVPFLAG